ncbi:MAG: hypothetical protein QG575_41 [Euryarchaeota archaeon]|nr:hypothetical protein [Euryarchaeota archaeon]
MKREQLLLEILLFMILSIISCHGQTTTNILPEPSSNGYSYTEVYPSTNIDNLQQVHPEDQDIIIGRSRILPEEKHKKYSPMDLPYAEPMPTVMPQASYGDYIPYLYHGEDISVEDISKIGGEIGLGPGIQIYIRYNNIWYQDPTAYWSNQNTNSIIYIDDSQNIKAYIKYPDGQIIWKDWGFWREGYHAAKIIAGTDGWNQIAIWGERSGWSNVLWIYIWK